MSRKTRVKSNSQLLEKASFDYSDLASGGKLTPQDADQFITYMFDEADPFFKSIQTLRMTSETRNIDIFSIATRQTRKKQAGTAPADLAGPTLDRNILQSVKCVFPFEVEDEFIEENIEREGFWDTLMKEVAIAVSNDMLDLGFNGDTTSGDPFININDGWIKIGIALANAYDATGALTEKAILKGMLQTLPRQFKANKGLLRYFVSPEFEENYRAALAGRATGLGDAYLDQDKRARYMGIVLEPVGPMPYANAFLGVAKNFVTGVQIDIKVETDRDILRGVDQVVVTYKNDFQFAVNEGIVTAHSIPSF